MALSYGDEIMAGGHALAIHKETGKRVRIADLYGRTRWSGLWYNLDWIVVPGEDESGAAMVVNGPFCRPYISYPFTIESGCRFTGWRARDHLGALRFSSEEWSFANKAGLEAFVVIEPNIPVRSNPNKQWGREKWQALVDFFYGGVPFVQLGPPGTEILRGVRHIETPTFRHAAALLTMADAIIVPEGGLHHAAGALALDAIVLFGGSPSVEATGYPWHENIADTSPLAACGRWSPCDHCAEFWRDLAPEFVARKLAALLLREE